MQIPRYFEIRTADGKPAAFLSPKTDKIKNVYVDYYLNGESKFEFQIPATSKKLKEITPECQIWAGGKVYSILNDESIDIVRDEKGTLWAKIMAVERWAELDTQFPEPFITNDPNTPTPSDLSVIIVGAGSDLSGGLYQVGTAGHALYACLKGSGWSVGIVDVHGIHDLEMEKTSRLQLVKQIQNIWGGYLIWDSVNKTISLRDPNKWQNYTGFQIRYKKNLKNITRTQSNRIITKLFCFGKDDLDIASVNGGKKYVTNNSYTSREYTAIYRNPDIEDPTELRNAGIAELSLICHPKYLYKVKIADLRTLPAYSHEDFTVGDMADVIDPDVAPDSPRPRIVHHKYNLFQPWNCELDIGDPEERLEEMLKAAFGTSGYIDNTLTSRGQLSGYKLVDGSIEDAKVKNLSVEKLLAGTIRAQISIYSPLIIGGEIRGGSITSDSVINVATDAIIGNNLYMGDKYNSDIKKIWFRSGAIIQNAPDPYGGATAISISAMKLRIDCDTLTSYLDGSATTNVVGFFNYSKATVQGLNNGSSWYATQEWVSANFAPKT